MNSNTKPVTGYIHAIEKKLALGDATEHTHRAEFLKIDFPRLPLTLDKELFRALVAKGAELVSLHLMESPTLNNLITRSLGHQ